MIHLTLAQHPASRKFACRSRVRRLRRTLDLLPLARRKPHEKNLCSFVGRFFLHFLPCIICTECVLHSVCNRLSITKGTKNVGRKPATVDCGGYYSQALDGRRDNTIGVAADASCAQPGITIRGSVKQTPKGIDMTEQSQADAQGPTGAIPIQMYCWICEKTDAAKLEQRGSFLSWRCRRCGLPLDSDFEAN